MMPGEWDWMKRLGLGMPGFDPSSMPAPSAVTAPIKSENALQGLARRIGEGLFPMIGAQEAGMSPAEIMQAQKAARKQMGLGMLANMGSGGGFGQGLGRGMGLAQQGLQDTMQRQQTQYALAQRQAEQDRAAEERAQEREIDAQRFERTMQVGLGRDAAAADRWREERTTLTPWQQAQIDEGKADRAARYAQSGLGQPPKTISTPNGVLEYDQITGQWKPIPGAEANSRGAKITEGEQRALSQVTRMQNAEKSLKTLGYEPVGAKGGADIAAASVPGVGNMLTSSKYQAYQQSAREWIAGLLRYDSGAAVPETEFARYYSTYFPQIGDGPEVVKQKAKARTEAVDSMKLGLPDAAVTRLDSSRSDPNDRTFPSAPASQGGYDFEYIPGQGLRRASR